VFEIYTGGDLKIILSHPFSGAVYWWFMNQQDIVGEDLKSKKPHHGYYRTLYGNVDKNLDVALACTVIFDEIILPAIDAPIPGTAMTNRMYQPDLAIAADWEQVNQAQELVRPHERELLNDTHIKAVLKSIPKGARPIALLYAAADVVLGVTHKAPIVCAPGRMSIVARLLQLGVVPTSGFDIDNFSAGASLTHNVADYAAITGITFNSEDVGGLGGIKWNEAIRRYADGFQAWLNENEAPEENALWEAIAEARADSEVARGMSGYFKANSRALSLISLLPGVGTVTGALAIASDYAGEHQERKATRLDWHQLGPEIEAYKKRRAIDNELSRRGLI
jgi:hypothetical protein